MSHTYSALELLIYNRYIIITSSAWKSLSQAHLELCWLRVVGGYRHAVELSAGQGRAGPGWGGVWKGKQMPSQIKQNSGQRHNPWQSARPGRETLKHAHTHTYTLFTHSVGVTLDGGWSCSLSVLNSTREWRKSVHRFWASTAVTREVIAP